MKRYCDKFIEKDLLKKMVFLGGPRQVGKTTLSKQLLTGKWADGEYLNWDIDEDKRAIVKKQWLKSSPLVIFDEIHKYPRWKRIGKTSTCPSSSRGEEGHVLVLLRCFLGFFTKFSRILIA